MLFSVLPSDRKIDSEHTLKYRKFYLNTGRKTPNLCPTPTQLAQERFGISILGDIQSPSGHGAGQPALGDHPLSSGTGLDDLQRSLPTSIIVHFFRER